MFLNLPCILALIALASGAAPATEPATIADLQRIAGENIGAVARIKIRFVEIQHQVDTQSGNRQFIAERDITIAHTMDFTRFRCDTRQRYAGMDATTETIESRNGHTAKTFLPQMRTGFVRRNKPTTIGRGTNTVLRSAMLYPATMETDAFDDLSLLSMLKNGRVVGSEEVAGVNCAVVEVTKVDAVVARLWLDPSAGGLMRKAITLGTGGEVVAETRVTRVMQVESGDGANIWLPAEIEQNLTSDGHQIEVLTVIEENTVAVNDRVQDDDLKLAFPDGTSVLGDKEEPEAQPSTCGSGGGS